MIRNGVLQQGGSDIAGFELLLRKFTSSASGESQTTWDTSVAVNTRVTENYITAAYRNDADTGAGNQVLKLTYNAAPTSSVVSVAIHDQEISTTADTTSTVRVTLDDGN